VGQDVRSWLEAEGFAQYAELFESREVDVEALALLTEAHLQEMGIPLGPRVRLLAAIARRQASQPERRRLTLMFVDLVGSTALSGRLDPEELGKLLGDYQRAVATAVARYEAYVARYVGDGALIYFGYPRAHEDDAERALRAALDIVRAVSALRTPDGVPLQARLGVATGLVVVGGLMGSGEAVERAVLGETPNIAARLQALAEPNGIVVSAGTRALTGTLFEWRELGALALKGLDRPHEACALLGERAIASRFEAQRGGLRPMLGRDAELGRLRALWEQATRGHGQLVVVHGEAGIGKSRLLRALEAGLDQPHARIVNQCSPYHTESALYPCAQQIARAARIDAAQGEDERLRRVESLLLDAQPADIVLIASLLGLDATPRHGKPDITPERQRARTFDALLGQVLGAAARSPVVWVLEDAHWADPTTLELVSFCVERIASARVLAIITARPEFSWTLPRRPHVHELALARLTRPDAASLVEQVAEGRHVPAELVAEIVARCDGVPLYVEEVTKALLESAVPDAPGPPGAAVPASLHDSMMARLDRHPGLKEVAQVAACIGREFSGELLARACDRPVEALAEGLARLEEAELVFRRGGDNAGRYVFKHALVRDAAYESLLRSRRQEIHGRIYDALAPSPDLAPELLAQHAAAAGRTAEAIECWRRAGLAAIARPAYREAIAHVRQALALAESMPPSPEWLGKRLELTLLLGQAIIPLRGYSHSETLATFRQAQALVEALPEAPHRFSVSFAMWVAHYVRGEHPTALAIASDMLERARRDGSQGRTLSALRALGIGQMITGQLVAARASFEQAQTLAWVVRRQSRENRIAVAHRFAADPDIATQFHMALTDWALGEVDRACEITRQALAAARAMGHVHTLGHALAHGAIFAGVMRDVALTRELSAETLAFAGEHDMDLWRGYGAIMHGYAALLAGDFAPAATAMRLGFAVLASAETGAMVPSYRAALACALARAGNFTEAERESALASRALRESGERYFGVEALRWLGAYRECAPGGGAEAAEDAYAQALELAREMGARSFELAAATSLAASWERRGCREQALRLLAPLAAGFTQGEATPGPMEAAQLLARLQMQEAQALGRAPSAMPS
jgi:class 3 adenylate cyclase/predicted ATPase